jgi:hypothetical protein
VPNGVADVVWGKPLLATVDDEVVIGGEIPCWWYCSADIRPLPPMSLVGVGICCKENEID